METEKELLRDNKYCDGCFAHKIGPDRTSCLVLIKEAKKGIFIYELIPDKCPCRDCIVKITCRNFCSIIHTKIKQIGSELNV